MLIHKIDPANISPIEIFWKLRIRNWLSCFILFLIQLSLIQSRLSHRCRPHLTQLLLRLIWYLSQRSCLVCFFIILLRAKLSIIFMMLLVLARIRFPSNIQIIDCWYQQVVLVTGNVLQMSIVASVFLFWWFVLLFILQVHVVIGLRRSLWAWVLRALSTPCPELILNHSNLFSTDLLSLSLELSRHSFRIVLCKLLTLIHKLLFASLLHNPFNLHAAILFLLDTLLNIEVADLAAIEALDGMTLKGARSVGLLDETNHGVVTLRLEIVVGVRREFREFWGAILRRVRTYHVFDIVAEISNETLVVAELDFEGLIVNGAPRALDGLWVTLVVWLAFLCCGLISIEKLYSKNFFLRKIELEIFWKNLHFVWKLVSANFLCLEQIDCFALGIDVKVPCSKCMVFETMNWLISIHRSYVWPNIVVTAQEQRNYQRLFHWSHSFLFSILHFR